MIELGSKVQFVSEQPDYAMAGIIGITGLERIIHKLKINDRILFRDGKVACRVTQINENDVIATCIESMIPIQPGGACALPDTEIEFQVVSDVDT